MSHENKKVYKRKRNKIISFRATDEEAYLLEIEIYYEIKKEKSL